MERIIPKKSHPIAEAALFRDDFPAYFVTSIALLFLGVIDTQYFPIGQDHLCRIALGKYSQT